MIRMSPTSIAKARLRPEAEIVPVAGIEVEIAVDAAGGLVAAVVDAGGVEVVAADGTAVVMADTAAAGDDTRPHTKPYTSTSWSCDFGCGSFFALCTPWGFRSNLL